MPGIVPPKPTCTRCGAPVQRLRKCPRCGRRSFASLFTSGFWVRH